MPTAYLLAMLLGYLMTIAIETAVLVALLSRRHPLRVRIFAGIWLTACTYPVVWLVLPELFERRWLYLLIAEIFAPVAECVLFWFAFIRRLPPQPFADDEEAEEWWFIHTIPRERRSTLRDFAVITLANLCSFGFGEVFNSFGGFDFILRYA
jgi:hypothetical protein